MNLKGKHTYNTSAQEIWNILMNTEKLAKITPGVSRLEETGTDQYNAVSEIKIGPVKGAFKGDLFLEDKKEPNEFTLKVKQLSKIGNADATVQIQINELNDKECELAFNGKAKLSGTLARTGQRVLTGVANTLTKQFFKALEEEVAASRILEATDESTTVESTSPPVEIPTASPTSEEKTTAPSITTNQNISETINSTSDEVKDIVSEAVERTTNSVQQPESGGFIAWLKSLFGMK